MGIFIRIYIKLYSLKDISHLNMYNQCIINAEMNENVILDLSLYLEQQ